MPETPNVLRSPSRLHEEGPKILRVVVPLVIVDLLGDRHSEPERRELQEPLAPPGGNVHEAHAARSEQPVQLRERFLSASTDARAPRGRGSHPGIDHEAPRARPADSLRSRRPSGARPGPGQARRRRDVRSAQSGEVSGSARRCTRTRSRRSGARRTTAPIGGLPASRDRCRIDRRAFGRTRHRTHEGPRYGIGADRIVKVERAGRRTIAHRRSP